MPPLLGPADSFNSSSATIRPDKRDEESSNQTNGRELGPASSIGRDFESLFAGRAGVLQSDTGLGDADELSRMLNDFNAHPSISPTISPQAAGFTPQFNVFSNSTTTDFFQPTSSPAFGEEYRPSSAASNHSVHSGHSIPAPSPHFSNHSYNPRLSISSTDISDSYTTTDFDTDAEGQGQTSASPLPAMGGLNIDGWNGAGATISPDAEGLGRRRRRTEEPDVSEDEVKRLQRLEHRRSINRRSAQKHRLMRKQETEALTRQVKERDAKIVVLEQELATMKKQFEMAMKVLKSHGLITE